VSEKEGGRGSTTHRALQDLQTVSAVGAGATARRGWTGMATLRAALVRVIVLVLATAGARASTTPNNAKDRWKGATRRSGKVR
jgi:hypothetical protein